MEVEDSVVNLWWQLRESRLRRRGEHARVRASNIRTLCSKESSGGHGGRLFGVAVGAAVVGRMLWRGGRGSEISGDQTANREYNAHRLHSFLVWLLVVFLLVLMCTSSSRARVVDSECFARAACQPVGIC